VYNGKVITEGPKGLFLITKNIMGLIEYIKDTKGEMKHVSWPTKKQAISYTMLVILISVLVAFFLGLADFSFSKLLGSIITL
jgi:preprotein translocase subunit SecE